jgi:hypothetical protein
MMSSSNSNTIRFLLIYVKMVRELTDFIFNPIRDFLSPYSKSLGRTVDIVSEVTSNFLILSPFLVSFLGIGIGVFGFEGTISDFTNIDLQITLGIIMIFSSILVFTLSQESEDELLQSIYLSLLLVIGGTSIMYFKTPELYAVLFGVIYGIGGYTISYIKYENPLSHGYIYEDLEPHKRIRKSSYLLAGITSVLYLLGYYLESSGFSTEVTVIPFATIPFVAFITTTFQTKSYKQIYRHAGINTKSPIWILTPRLLIIFGIGLSVSSMNITIASLLFLLSPSIFGLVFSYYINSQTEQILGKTTFTSSDLYSKPIRITGYEQAEIDVELDDKKETAEFNANIKIEITEDIPSDATGPWIEATESSKHMIKALESLSRVDEGEIEKLKKFKRQTLNKSIEKYEGDLHELPNEVAKEVAYLRTKKSDLDLQDVCELEISLRDTDKRPSSEYVSKSPKK